MQRNVVILDIDYVTYEDKPIIRLFSKDGDKNIILIDDTFEPYLYVVCDDLDECIAEIQDNISDVRIEKVIKKDFQIENEFLKVIFKHPTELANNRDVLRDLESVIQIREFDIPFYRRYLMDRDVIPMTEVVAIGDKLDSFLDLDSNKQDIEIIRLTDELKRTQDYPHDFRILSFDLEVRNPHGMPNSEVDEIIMIGVSSNFGVNQVISTKTNSDSRDNFVNQVESEKEMIEEFVKIIKENNIDIIVGYNSDNFDFPYLKDRAKILGVDLDIGMDGSDVKFIRRGFTNAASFKGLIHVDLYLVMRRYMTLERYTLERVYYELFGEEKIDVPGDRIWEFWDNEGEELDNLFDYSLDDVVSTLKIAQQTLPLNLELTRIIGQPLFDVSRMATGQQAEWFLVKQAYFDNEIVPNKKGSNFANRAADENEGGYVREPEKGLHENLVQFDFRSLYPSIIISKNISPDVMYLGDVDGEDEYNISPEHDIKFKKEPKGFIPSVIDKILQERFRIKREMKVANNDTEKKALDVQQQAIKRLANTMYGIYGFPRFRWYSFECAKAITSWGRQYIKSSIKMAEEYGFYAIYADTDGFYAKYKKEKE
ncbi:MAG: DNA polymerase domain-containing protein [Methanobrevibacter sp.]|uniref:DNA polymerase domain-containing protein n=1 Tax=Methanobrevibacter sp. TaxID=66852 RepID=UPI003F001120